MIPRMLKKSSSAKQGSIAVPLSHKFMKQDSPEKAEGVRDGDRQATDTRHSVTEKQAGTGTHPTACVSPTEPLALSPSEEIVAGASNIEEGSSLADLNFLPSYHTSQTSAAGCNLAGG